MMTRRLTLAAGMLLLVPGGAAFAQQGAVEFGVDAGYELSIVDNSDNVSSVGIPLQNLRIGFFVSDAVSIEPSVSSCASSVAILSSGGTTLTTFSGAASLLYHLSQDPAQSRMYLRGGAGIAVIDLGSNSVNQMGVSGGIGVKAPAGPLAIRIEGHGGYSFENDDLASSIDLGVLFGISFFTN